MKKAKAFQIVSFFFQNAAAKQEIRLGYFFGESAIDHIASRTHLTIVTDLSFYESEVALHLLEASSDFERPLSYWNSRLVAHIQMCRHSRGL